MLDTCRYVLEQRNEKTGEWHAVGLPHYEGWGNYSPEILRIRKEPVQRRFLWAKWKEYSFNWEAMKQTGNESKEETVEYAKSLYNESCDVRVWKVAFNNLTDISRGFRNIIPDYEIIFKIIWQNGHWIDHSPQLTRI